jgi:hypothetical protein
MVEMAMCDEHPFDFFCFSEETTDVWKKIIKSWTFSTTSEFETTIHEEDLIIMLDHRHIGSDSSEASDRDNTSDIALKFWKCLWFVRFWKYHRHIQSLESCWGERRILLYERVWML